MRTGSYPSDSNEYEKINYIGNKKNSLILGGSETDDLTSGGHFSNCKTADHLVNKQADDTQLIQAVWEASEHLIESVFTS